MLVTSLSLVDFRSYAHLELELGPGLTAVVGPNGRGKTNLLEALGWLSAASSFRGAPDDALVRTGADRAVIRSVVRGDDGREVSLDAEIARVGRNRIQVNGRRLPRARDLLGILQVTVFSPDDLELVKGSPGVRRRWLDDAVVARHRRHDALRADLERILRQRNSLLRQSRGRLDADAAVTLDVWDDKLAAVGDALRRARTDLLEALGPRLDSAYEAVARDRSGATARPVSSWGDGPLAEALAAARDEDLRRQVTTVGPHRDEVALAIGGRPARTHASQGEQRSLSLALRLAVDEMLRDEGVAEPVLLLDDVFSELDHGRAAALLGALPEAQRLLTTATGLPEGATPEQVFEIDVGGLRRVA